MRAKQVFEYALIELNKRKAPSLVLEDYNYFINKAVNQYINRMYNAYELNQQKTDDIRVLKSSAVLTPITSTEWSTSSLLDNTHEVNLPDDYLHILNCIVEYTVLRNYKCYSANTKWQQTAKRITADAWGGVINNYYLRPSYKNPYYCINNVADESSLISIDGEKVAGTRYGNASKVRVEIRYGKDDSTFRVSKVYVDYIKSPQFIKLTQDQIDEVEDTSQILEFPDYVCQEIVNELVKLLMENASDPRLQSHIPVSQSIAMPGQEQRR